MSGPSNFLLQSLATAHNALHTGQIEKGERLLSVLRTTAGAQKLLDTPPVELFGVQWSGESLAGKSIQVFADQGMGDLIQLLRYLPILKQQGCQIVLNCYAWHRQFAELMTQALFVDEFVSSPVRCDYWTNIFCIPFIINNLPVSFPPRFSLLLDSVPPAPEFKATKALDLPGAHKIGVAWQSNLDNKLSIKKSLKVEALAHLQERGTCYSLLPDLPTPDWLCKVEINNLQDTANLIAAMDEVYSVDTCALHLAGSMKKKTTALLCSEHDPRWNKNVWYENMSIQIF